MAPPLAFSTESRLSGHPVKNANSIGLRASKRARQQDYNNISEVSGSDVTNLDSDQDEIPFGEWEGEVVEEVFSDGVIKFKVAWVPTLEPAANLSAKMKTAWEMKKIERKSAVSDNRELFMVSGRSEQSGIKRRPDRPRKR